MMNIGHGGYMERSFSKNAKLYLYAMIFYSIATGAFGMLQGIYIKELKIGEDFLGLLISSKTLAMAIAAFPCALVVSRIGKKKSLFVSMMAICLAIFFQGYFKNMWVIYAFAIFQGLFDALLSVTGGPFLMENSKGDQRIRLFSISFAVSTFSVMGGYYIFGQVIDSFNKSINLASSYRYGIIIASLVGILSLIFIGLIGKENLEESKEKAVSLRDSIGVFKEKGVFQFIIYNSFIGFGAGLVVPYFNGYEIPYYITTVLYVLGTLYFYKTFKNFNPAVMVKKLGFQEE